MLNSCEREFGQNSVPRLYLSQKKSNWRLATSTIFRDQPFGECVEGLSYFRAKSHAVENAVQKHDFQQSTLGTLVCGKRLLFQGLRKFKDFRRQVGRFVAGAVQNVQLQVERCQPVA